MCETTGVPDQKADRRSTEDVPDSEGAQTDELLPRKTATHTLRATICFKIREDFCSCCRVKRPNGALLPPPQ